MRSIHTSSTFFPVKVFLGACLVSLLGISNLSFAKEYSKDFDSETISIPEVTSGCVTSVNGLPKQLSFQQRANVPWWWVQNIEISGLSQLGGNFVPNSKVILQKRVLRPYPAWQLLVQSPDNKKVSVATASKDTILLQSWRNSYTIRDCNNKKVAQIAEAVVKNAIRSDKSDVPAFRQWTILDLRSEKPREIAKVAVKNISGNLTIEIADNNTIDLLKYKNWNSKPLPFDYSGNVTLEANALDVLDPLVVLFLPVLLDPFVK